MKQLKRLFQRVKVLLKNHFWKIFAGALFLGSWLAQNYKGAEWSGEKQRLFNWLTIQEVIWTDVGQWHVAILEYYNRYEEINGTNATFNLINDRKYAGLCSNWLHLYFGFINISHEITESDVDQRFDKQKKVIDTMGSLDSYLKKRNYAFVVNLYDKKVDESDAEVRDSALRIRTRLGIIEQNENQWNKLFVGFYIFATLVFAIDFIKNPPETLEKTVH